MAYDQKFNILSKGERLPYVPSQEPFATGPLGFSAGENLEFINGAYTPRGGSRAIHAAPSVGTNVGGAVIGSYVYNAMLSGGFVTLWERLVSGGSWVQINGSSGAYGDTRLSEPTGLINFSGFASQGGTPVIIIQDGINTPLQYVQNFGANTCVKCNTVDAPKSWPVVWSCVSGLTMSAGTDTDDSNLKAAVTAGVWRFSTTGAVAVGEKARVTNTNVNFSTGKQVWIVIKNYDPIWVDSVKWRLVSTGPTTFDLPLYPVVVLTNIPGLAILAFDVQQENLSSVIGIEMEATKALASGLSVDVYAVCASGNVRGTGEYTVSYSTKNGASESQGITLPNEGVKVLPGAVMPDGFRLPISPDLYYQTEQVVKSSLEALTGVSTCIIYRQDPGDDQAYSVIALTMSEFSGSWALTANFATKQYTYTDNVLAEDKLYWSPAPSEWNEAIPIGVSYSDAGRHYVGTRVASGSRYGQSIKVSDQNMFWRFRSVTLNFDPDEGYEKRLTGTEKAVAFQASSTSTVGRPEVFGITDFGAQTVGPVSSKISSVGGAGAIVEHEGPIYYVTADSQIAVLQANSERISRGRVDSLITLPLKASAASFGERVYFAFGTTVLVWSVRDRDWEPRHTYATGIGTLIQDPTRANLWAITTGGAFIALEDRTIATDLTLAFNCSLTTGLFCVTEQDKSVTLRFMEVLMSSATTITTARIPLSGSTISGSIVNTASTPMWRQEVITTPVEAKGTALQARITFAAAVGLELYGWRIEVDGMEPDADA